MVGYDPVRLVSVEKSEISQTFQDYSHYRLLVNLHSKKFLSFDWLSNTMFWPEGVVNHLNTWWVSSDLCAALLCQFRWIRWFRITIWALMCQYSATWVLVSTKNPVSSIIYTDQLFSVFSVHKSKSKQQSIQFALCQSHCYIWLDPVCSRTGHLFKP